MTQVFKVAERHLKLVLADGKVYFVKVNEDFMANISADDVKDLELALIGKEPHDPKASAVAPYEYVVVVASDSPPAKKLDSKQTPGKIKESTPKTASTCSARLESFFESPPVAQKSPVFQSIGTDRVVVKKVPADFEESVLLYALDSVLWNSEDAPEGHKVALKVVEKGTLNECIVQFATAELAKKITARKVRFFAADLDLVHVTENVRTRQTNKVHVSNLPTYSESVLLYELNSVLWGKGDAPAGKTVALKCLHSSVSECTVEFATVNLAEKISSYPVRFYKRDLKIKQVTETVSVQFEMKKTDKVVFSGLPCNHNDSILLYELNRTLWSTNNYPEGIMVAVRCSRKSPTESIVEFTTVEAATSILKETVKYYAHPLKMKQIEIEDLDSVIDVAVLKGDRMTDIAADSMDGFTPLKDDDMNKGDRMIDTADDSMDGFTPLKDDNMNDITIKYDNTHPKPDLLKGVTVPKEKNLCVTLDSSMRDDDTVVDMDSYSGRDMANLSINDNDFTWKDDEEEKDDGGIIQIVKNEGSSHSLIGLSAEEPDVVDLDRQCAIKDSMLVKVKNLPPSYNEFEFQKLIEVKMKAAGFLDDVGNEFKIKINLVDKEKGYALLEFEESHYANLAVFLENVKFCGRVLSFQKHILKDGLNVDTSAPLMSESKELTDEILYKALIKFRNEFKKGKRLDHGLERLKSYLQTQGILSSLSDLRSRRQSLQYLYRRYIREGKTSHPFFNVGRVVFDGDDISILQGGKFDPDRVTDNATDEKSYEADLSRFRNTSLWHTRSVKALVGACLQKKDDYDKPQLRTKFWNEISSILKDKDQKWKYSAQQCKSKMERLRAAAKDYNDNFKGTGAEGPKERIADEDGVETPVEIIELVLELHENDVSFRPRITGSAGLRLTAHHEDSLLTDEEESASSSSSRRGNTSSMGRSRLPVLKRKAATKAQQKEREVAAIEMKASALRDLVAVFKNSHEGKK